MFEVNDGLGGAGVTARKTLYNDDLSASDARFIRLDTRKAFESGWGIKLKEMRIIGNAKPCSASVTLTPAIPKQLWNTTTSRAYVW